MKHGSLRRPIQFTKPVTLSQDAVLILDSLVRSGLTEKLSDGVEYLYRLAKESGKLDEKIKIETIREKQEKVLNMIVKKIEREQKESKEE